MPRAYIEIIFSSKSGNRRWYLAISFGSKVPARSRGTDSVGAGGVRGLAAVALPGSAVASEAVPRGPASAVEVVADSVVVASVVGEAAVADAADQTIPRRRLIRTNRLAEGRAEPVVDQGDTQ
jgi:hypothetical protein